jgi:hypothetical protein
MASKGFSEPSSGQSFTEMSNGVTAHNDLMAGFPSFGNSMAQGNGVTDKSHDQLGMPGSPSEQTMSDDTPWAASSHDTPDLETSHNVGTIPNRVH